MELWYDPNTMELKAHYRDKYNGSVWPDSGYVAYSEPEVRDVPTEFQRSGAIIDFDQDGLPFVATSAPPPQDNPRSRLDDLIDASKNRDLSVDELNEAFRLEHH